jgi:hypothetical protein
MAKDRHILIANGTGKETCTAWPVATQMLYSDMKSSIEGLLSLEPTREVAHKGTMLWAGRVEGGEGEGGAPACHEPSTLCEGEADRHGVG